MQVPSIGDLDALFESEPLSIAEVALDRFLPLEQWPHGEVRIRSRVADRTVTVELNPSAERVAVEVHAPDLVSSITLLDVLLVEADSKGHGLKALAVQCRSGSTLTIRLRPDISVHYDAHP